MNNKGFTLIEITAVVVVLVAIFLVSFPNFINMAKTQDDNQYNSMVESICMAGESYIHANSDSYGSNFEPGNVINVDINVLIEENMVEKNLENPKTKKSVVYDTLSYKVLDDYSLECTYK